MRYQLVEKQVLYEGRRIKLEIQHLDDELTGKRLRREVVVHPGAVVILGFLPDQRLLLIRNRRYTIEQTLVELPAGTLEKGEDPINCAGRELMEETGYIAGRLKALGSFYSSPGIMTEKMYVYAAYDLEHQGQSLDESEEIIVLPVTMERAIDMIRQGEIVDGKTIAAILLYQLKGQ